MNDLNEYDLYGLDTLHYQFLQSMNEACIGLGMPIRKAVVENDVYVNVRDLFEVLGTVEVNVFDVLFPMRYAPDGRPIGRGFDDRFLTGRDGGPSVADGAYRPVGCPGPSGA